AAAPTRPPAALRGTDTAAPAPADSAEIRTPPSKPVSALAPSIARTVPAVTVRRETPAPRPMRIEPEPVRVATARPAPGRGAATARALPPEARAAVLPAGTRILPRHLYEVRAKVLPSPPPPGYAPAWEDGRLNPHRANMSIEGYRRTQLVWTRTVPRELVRGAPAGIEDPVLLYPDEVGRR
ncbi:hypothetical protein ACXYMW_19040, partial [Roseivivax sp. CAU 1761]